MRRGAIFKKKFQKKFKVFVNYRLVCPETLINSHAGERMLKNTAIYIFLKLNLILDHTLRIVVYKVHFKGRCHKGFQTDCGLFKAANRSRLRLIEPFLFLFTKAFICSTQCKFCDSKLFTLRSLSFGENKSKALKFKNREK